MKNAIKTALSAGQDTTMEDELVRLSDDDPTILKDLKKQLIENNENYKAKRHYKYFYAGVGAILGILIGMIIPKLIYKVNSAMYDRKGLEEILEGYLGGVKFAETATDEVMIVAYDYNSQEPRFFSKYMAKKDPFIYDVTLNDATGASSAAPTFFDPKVNEN
jgi:patatin-like phospholipase/acyl hydrolase